SEHLRCERDDLHELLGAELARDRSEDARTDRLFLRVDEDGAVLIELDVAPVRAQILARGADDDRARGVALLDLGAREALFDRDHDHVAERGVLASRSAEHFDALDEARAGVVSDLEVGGDLDHGAYSTTGREMSLVTSQRLPREMGRCSWISTRSPVLNWFV